MEKIFKEKQKTEGLKRMSQLIERFDLNPNLLKYKTENGDALQLLGVHMPINYVEIHNKIIKNVKDEFFWLELSQYAQNKDLLIIGDFNAYDNAKSKYQKEYKTVLSNKYVDIIEDNAITFKSAKTKVDHILKTESMPEMEAIVKTDIDYSDHYPIVVEIKGSLESKTKDEE